MKQKNKNNASLITSYQYIFMDIMNIKKIEQIIILVKKHSLKFKFFSDIGDAIQFLHRLYLH